jgi:hypothetical protein
VLLPLSPTANPLSELLKDEEVEDDDDEDEK